MPTNSITLLLYGVVIQPDGLLEPTEYECETLADAIALAVTLMPPLDEGQEAKAVAYLSGIHEDEDGSVYAFDDERLPDYVSDAADIPALFAFIPEQSAGRAQ